MGTSRTLLYRPVPPIGCAALKVLALKHAGEKRIAALQRTSAVPHLLFVQ